MKNELLRVYSYGDAFMLERANTLHFSFLDNIADFTAMDAGLDAAFATAWQGEIDAAMAAISDSQVIGIQMDKTNDVLVQMELCRKKYTQIKYFVSVAYPNNPTKQGLIRLHKYTDVRQSQSKMILFMDDLWEDCVRNSVALLAAGMTQPQIDEIETLKNALIALNSNQENYRDFRPTLTNERVLALNTCYETTMRIVRAAQSVYYDDYARSRAFMFNPTGGGNGGGGEDAVTINATIPNDGNTIEVYSVLYIPTRNIEVTNNGPEDIEIFIANLPEEGGTPMAISNGLSMPFTADQLGPFGDKIFVRTLANSIGDTTIILEIAVEE